ncbi:MAG: hypothetical protein EOO48_04225 [Flavobacterium sp.]|nr:MAG: hypothetical protein EOO48_04225 [Flavobacterium sp.]
MPWESGVTAPVTGSIVATAVLLLVHVPDPVEEVNTAPVLPTQIDGGPEITGLLIVVIAGFVVKPVAVVTRIFPVVAVAGTMTESCVGLMMVTDDAAVPLKVTVKGAMKFVPFKVIDVFAHAIDGTDARVGRVYVTMIWPLKPFPPARAVPFDKNPFTLLAPPPPPASAAAAVPSELFAVVPIAPAPPPPVPPAPAALPAAFPPLPVLPAPPPPPPPAALTPAAPAPPFWVIPVAIAPPAPLFAPPPFPPMALTAIAELNIVVPPLFPAAFEFPVPPAPIV